jgi:hypothetical protein
VDRRDPVQPSQAEHKPGLLGRGVRGRDGEDVPAGADPAAQLPDGEFAERQVRELEDPQQYLSPHPAKVFRKLRFQVTPNDINAIVAAVPGAVERVLYLLYSKIRSSEQERQNSDFDSPDGRNVVFSAESKLNTQISAQLAEKEEAIRELRSTIEILETKMRRMEELNRLKDAKIESLIRKLEQGIN